MRQSLSRGAKNIQIAGTWRHRPLYVAEVNGGCRRRGDRRISTTHTPRCQHSTLLSRGIASSRPLQEHKISRTKNSRNRLCSTRSMVPKLCLLFQFLPSRETTALILGMTSVSMNLGAEMAGFSSQWEA